MAKVRYLRKNLIAFTSDGHSLEVLPVDHPKVKKTGAVIDHKAGTWRSKDPLEYTDGRLGRARKIGTTRYTRHYQRYGVLGVFDRTKLSHLNSMIFFVHHDLHENRMDAD